METQDTLRAGTVWLIGAGPGDPELLTVKVARLIAQADAVVFDHLVGDGIIDLARADARRIYRFAGAGVRFVVLAGEREAQRGEEDDRRT